MTRFSILHICAIAHLHAITLKKIRSQLYTSMQLHKSKRKKKHKDPCGKSPKQNSKRQKRPEKKFAINGKNRKDKKEGIIANIGKPTISPLINFFWLD
jgi:hypothetical protein